MRKELFVLEDLIPVAIAFALGGILKGATGAGTPILAVPVLALLYDVQFAVAVFVVPSLVSNVWQLWRFREDHVSSRFAWSFAGGGAAGAIIGSLMLAWLPSDSLMQLIAVGVFAYIGSRLLWRGWKLGFGLAARVVLPVGFCAGILQGATGISAPLSITFLNAMQLDRAKFVATISAFFAAISVVQLIMLTSLQILNREIFLYGCLALIPLLGFMPVGSALVRLVSKEWFDRIILMLLFLLAIKLLFSGHGVFA